MAPLHTSVPNLVRVAALAGTLLVSGCLDAPTIPEAVQQIAGGEAWVAIPEPDALPALDTWMPYVAGGDRESEAHARVADLARQAREARYEGQLGWAADLDREALRVAMRSLDRAPEPQVMARAVRALAEWSDRVDAGVDLRVYPDVGRSLRRVERARVLAEASLEAGDTVAAVVQLADGAAAIRSHAPTTVALRVLGRAESRLRAKAPPAAVLGRAVHLIRSARQELVDGDPSRALRRALYALQLAEGA